MRLLKKAAAVAVVSAMAVSMAGCGSKPAETTAAPTEAAKEEATEAAKEEETKAEATEQQKRMLLRQQRQPER